MNFVERDGVRLAYVEGGQGGLPVLLVHGMQCDHTHMLPLFAHLAPRHRVVAVDLRGHGASDKPEGGYTDPDFNDDLVFLCRELDIERPVAIGHSFGGSTLLHLSVARPDFLSGLVLLDSGVRSLAAKSAELGKTVDESTSTAGRRSAREFLGSRLFSPDDPPALREQILDQMDAVPSHVVSATGRTVLAFDAARAAERCRTPALFILAEKPFTDAETLGRLGPNWRVSQIVGAGHFIQLVVPAQVNAMVDRFLELISWQPGRP